MEHCSTLPCVLTWLGSNAAGIAALSAIIVALLAIWYALRQESVARRHDRLSVMPLLDIPFNYAVEAIHPDRPQLHCHVVLSLGNHGLGTAIIKKYEVYVDGKLIPNTPRAALEGAVLAALGLNKSQMSKMSFFAYQGDHSLPRDQSVQIIDIAFVAASQAAWDDFLQRFSQNIGARVAYMSLYGEQRTCEKGVVAKS
jgi:hypothetical protein